MQGAEGKGEGGGYRGADNVQLWFAGGACQPRICHGQTHACITARIQG